ncbi:MAG: SurA N-terminal domain-containing protein [Synergistaceae bacterium]|nr:SurA N-terminal domain-containing protein [Synergistaceae bacterium]
MMQYFRKNVRWIMLIIVILFVVSCFAGYGMYTGGRGDGTSDYIVARIDGDRVMRSEIEQEAGRMIQSMGMSESVTSADLPSIRSNVLDQLAIVKKLDQEVKSRKITATKDEIDAAFGDIESSFPTRELFLQQMQAAGLDERKLKSSIEEQILRQKVFDEVVAPASADEQEKRAFYDTMKAAFAFQRPEGFNVNVAHFTTEESAKAARAEVASGKAWDGVMEAASADVLDYSPYASPILAPLSQLTGPLEPLKDLPINKVTDVIKIADGDFLVAVKRSKEAARTSAYDEVSADIEQMVLGQKRQGLQANFLQDLRSKANVEILDDTIFSRPEVSAPAIPDDAAPEIAEDAATSPDEVNSAGAE